MLSTLRSKAPSGVALTSITATVTVPSAAIGAGGAGGAVAPTLTQGGKATVGQVTLSGTAPDKRSVAAYADRLASAKGLAAPLVSSIGAGSGDVTWSMTVAITSDAMGGRYSAPSATNATGGN
jgi:hypothetical protein